MKLSPQILLGFLLDFGALLIPTFYFLLHRGAGRMKKPMFIGAGLQLFWSMAVAALAYFSWRSGSKDAYMAWGLLLPVNGVSLLYFLTVLFVYRTKRKIKIRRNLNTQFNTFRDWQSAGLAGRFSDANFRRRGEPARQ
jgi:drug/metabolite transporter (DMT)-like permease